MNNPEQKIEEYQRQVDNLLKYKRLFFAAQEEIKRLKEEGAVSTGLDDNIAQDDDELGLTLDQSDGEDDLDLGFADGEVEDIELDDTLETATSAPVRTIAESEELLNQNLEKFRDLFFNMRTLLGEERSSNKTRIDHAVTLGKQQSEHIDKAEAVIDDILNKDDAFLGVLQPVTEVISDIHAQHDVILSQLSVLEARFAEGMASCEQLGIDTGEQANTQKRMLELETKLESYEKAHALERERKSRFEVLHIIDALRLIQLKHDPEDLLQAILDLCDRGDLRATGILAGAGKVVRLSERGVTRKKDIALIEKHKDDGDVVHLNKKILLNDKPISILLGASSEDVGEKSVLGLIRGFISITKWRITALEAGATKEPVANNDSATSEQLGKVMALGEQLILGIESQLKALENACLSIVDEQTDEISSLMESHDVDLSVQAELLATTESSREKIEQVLERYAHLDPRFKALFVHK
jgi:hypothetical protein